MLLRKPTGDHPRSRGVYPALYLIGGFGSGSSPLARGLRVVSQDHLEAKRIIPARAGFTMPPATENSHGADHPRSRGVYARALWALACQKGSSPLARGLRPPRWPCGGPVRIIPARAGFTPWRPIRPCPPRDHPRSRGVYLTTRARMVTYRGSSPLARGLPVRIHGPGQPGRDHPRSRGVYDRALPYGVSVYGSSPLARGLHAKSDFEREAARIIPARAGFTHRGRGTGPVWPDHPRSRGVYTA